MNRKSVNAKGIVPCESDRRKCENTKFLINAFKNVIRVLNAHENENYRIDTCKQYVTSALDMIDAFEQDDVFDVGDVAKHALWTLDTMLRSDVSIDKVECYVRDVQALLHRLRKNEIPQFLLDSVECVYNTDTRVIAEISDEREYYELIADYGFNEEHSEGRVNYAYNDMIGMCVIYVEDGNPTSDTEGPTYREFTE